MFDLDKYEEIWQSITRNKVRSLLTCFGVFWGILMLVLLLGAGQGLQNGIFRHTKGFALNSVIFWTNQTGEPYKGFKQGRWWNMKQRDLDMIRERIDGVEYLSSLSTRWRTDNNVVRGEKSGSFDVRGCYPVYLEKIEQQRVPYGRLLNEVDMREKRKVCVIGTRVYESLFAPGENPVGAYIRANGIYFQVVGVIDRIPEIHMMGDTKEAVSIPATTMQQAYNLGERIDVICATIKKGYKSADVENEIKTLLKEQNRISPTDPQAIGSFNLEQQARSFELLFLGIAILIWIVGIGTLMSGVVGVSNILLVTVKERTKEIGVRRAIGAKPVAIISQLMSESLTITFLAGILGLVAGIGLLDLVNKILANSPPSNGSFYTDPEVSFGTAVVATIILLISGLIAGIIPAWRALQIKAIDAIREE